MIVVEGPDGAGKTTLVNDLAKRLGLDVGVRRTGNRDDLYKYTVADSYDAIAAAVMAVGPPKIWDRMFYSDPIYANLVRNEESRFTHAQFNFLHRQVLAMRCPVIFCLPPIETVRANVNDGTHQLAGVVENIDEIYNEYRALAEGGDFMDSQLIMYDYTIRGSVPRIATRLREYLHHRRSREENPS